MDQSKDNEVAVTSNGKRRRFYENVAAVTVSEMMFFGEILLMGNHQLPSLRIYLGNFTHVLAILQP